MKEDTFDNIGKKLPYSESDEYLDSLLDRVAQHAIRQQYQTRWKKHWALKAASVAAVVILVLGIGLTVMDKGNNQSVAIQQADSPIDEFLNSLTDEEVAQLPYYEIEEIPEY